MIFFKKNKKKSIGEKPLSSTPSLKQQQETHSYDKRSSDSLLQFNLLDDFSSTIDIPQLLQQEDKSVVDTCSFISSFATNNRTSIYSVSTTIDKVNTTRSSIQPSPSFNSAAPYTTLPVSTIVIPEQKENSTTVVSEQKENTTKDSNNESKENMIDIRHDEGLNAGNSLTDPEEGDIKLRPDNRIIIPLLLTKENTVTLKEEQDDLAMYSNTLLFDDENSNNEEDKKDISIEDTNKSTLHCVIDDSPTLPPTLVTEENNINKLVITDELILKETTLELDHTLDLRSETEVHSLEISSLHEYSKPEEETANEKDENILVSDGNQCKPLLLNDEYTVVSNNDEKFQEKKQDVIGKRRSAHSFIPRKQNLLHATEEIPPMIKKLPTPSASTASPQANNFNVNRRGSSGSSSIPVPQQNRLSLTMIEKHWSPSSSSDSLSIKSPNSIHSNTSLDSATSKVIKPIAHNRLSSTNSNQTSKIPIFATKQPDIPKAVSSITNISRLPVKMSPTTAV